MKEQILELLPLNIINESIEQTNEISVQLGINLITLDSVLTHEEAVEAAIAYAIEQHPEMNIELLQELKPSFLQLRAFLDSVLNMYSSSRSVIHEL